MVTCRTYTIEKAPTPGFTLTADQYEGIGSFNTTLHISYPVGAGQIVRIVDSDPISGDSCLTTDIPLDGNGNATVPYSVIDTHTIYVIKTVGTGGENCCTSFSQTLCQYSNYITFVAIQPILTSIEISSPTISVIAEETIQFTTSCKDQSINPMTCPMLTWNSSNTSVGTINQSGLFTATNVTTQGTTDITASYSNITSNIITITVTPHILTSISILPINPTIQAGNTGQFTASCKDQYINPMTCPMLTWNSSNTSVGTINQSGLFTATNVTTQGTTDITASYSNITSNISTVTVTPPPYTGSIYFVSNPSIAQIWLALIGQTPIYQNTNTPGTISNIPIGMYDYILKKTNYNDYTGSVTVSTNQTTNITANLIPSEGCILFTSTPSNVQIWLAPSGQTLINQGITTPALICGLSLGEYCYKLVLLGYEDKTGCTTLDVGQGDIIIENLIQAPVLTNIIISPISLTINTGESRTFTTTCKDQNNDIMTCPIVTWDSSDINVGMIEQNGVFLAISPGTTIITATSDTISGSATVNVIPSPVLDKIIISPSTLSISTNNSAIFTATTIDQFGNPFPAIVTWSSSHENIGTIEQNGVFTAISPGTTTITASSGNISGIAIANVTQLPIILPVLTRIEIIPLTTTLTEGSNTVFSASTLDQFGNPIFVTVTWTSSDTSIGTITQNGVFTAISPGTTTIMSSSGNINGVALANVIPVVPTAQPTLANIVITPLVETVLVGTGTVFVASTLDQFGNSIVTPVTWNSSDPSVGTIDQYGIFSALHTGKTTITASGGDIIGVALANVVTTLPGQPTGGVLGNINNAALILGMAMVGAVIMAKPPQPPEIRIIERSRT